MTHETVIPYLLAMAASSIVLLSGGLDSALALVLALEKTTVLYGLTFDYNQKSAVKEILAAQRICKNFNIAHKVLQLDFFKKMNGHPLFDTNAECPQPKMALLDDKALALETAKAVWVPNRNGTFLNIAAGLAEMASAQYIYTGFNAEEARSFPDNSAGFLAALNQCLSYSTRNRVTAEAPTVSMTKKEILKTLLDKQFPLQFLWSCYNSTEKMCGACESCQRLKRAFKENGLKGPCTEMFLDS